MLLQSNGLVKMISIKSVFLQGEGISHDIFVKPPREAEVAGGIF